MLAELLLSIVPLLALIMILVWYEYKSTKVIDQKHQETQAAIEPVAKVANDLHTRKFGRASSEIGEVFPELKAVK